METQYRVRSWKIHPPCTPLYPLPKAPNICLSADRVSRSWPPTTPGEACKPLDPDNGGRDSHSSWHQWLELPLLLLTVQEEPVHDLVLLLRGDEVLNDEVPGGRNETEMGVGEAPVTKATELVGKGCQDTITTEIMELVFHAKIVGLGPLGLFLTSAQPALWQREMEPPNQAEEMEQL